MEPEPVPRAVTLRAMLAVALLAGFYVFGLLLLGCLVWVAVELFTAFGGTVGHDLGFGAGALLVAIAYPLWQFARAGEEPPLGVPVSEGQAPGLWATVRELAAAVDTRMPDEIRFYPMVNAAVREEAGRVGLRRGRRCLYVGVPLLRSLTVPQVRAVLTHELGHYAGGHTVFGAVVYSGGRSIARTMERIGPRRVAGWLLGVYGAGYFLVAMTVLRRMEAEADAAAARVAGVDATREALAAFPGLGSAWDVAVDSWVRAARDRGIDPDEALDAFDAQVAFDAWARGTADGVVAGDEAGDDGDRTPWDSHPPLAERLRLLAGLAPDLTPWPGAEADPAVPDPVSDPVVPTPGVVVADAVVADAVFADAVFADAVFGDAVVADSAVAGPAVADLPECAELDGPAMGAGLVADPEAALAALRDEGFVKTLTAAARTAAETDAEALFTACQRILPGATREGLGLVLDVLSLGRAADVVAALAQDAAGGAGVDADADAGADAGAEVEPGAESQLGVEADPEAGAGADPMAALVRDVSVAIGAHLVWAGLARWDFGWSRPLVLRSVGDDEPVVPEPVVADACGDPAAVARLREYLRELGVDEATTAPWAIPGRHGLDPGELTGSRYETHQPPRLLLPDELLMLIHRSHSRNLPTSDTMRAGVVAAILAELRLRGRLTVARDRAGLVGVCGEEPTGEPFLDGVLVRVAAGGQQPAYRWLQMLGPDAYAAAGERQRQLKGRWVYRDHGQLVYEHTEEALAQSVRRELLDAVRAGESDSRAAVLGMLLWATEATRPVLGRTALAQRFWLGRQAARDPLMVAVRTVTGLHTPFPGGTGIEAGR